MDKRTLKEFLGKVPFTVELYWLLRQRNQPPAGRFKLKNLQAHLPEMCRQIKPHFKGDESGKKVFIFATLHYWIEHAATLGLALAGQGSHVTLGYLPYGEWDKPINHFDLRRQNIYAYQVLQEAHPYLKIISLMDVRPARELPEELETALQQVISFDTQYTLQDEEFDAQHPVHLLRMERDRAAMLAAYAYLKANRPDVVIVPNGSIQELGVIYWVARHLNIPVVTYEFGDRREHIWLAQNAQIMRQEVDELWEARKDHPVRELDMQRLRSLFAARQNARLWETFSRLWQGAPAQGGQQIRADLKLDRRPVVLLPTNVFGDSLTLGRQVFSPTMKEWIARTVRYFEGRPDVQLVIRVHPGELLTHGTSMESVVRELLPTIPEHIHLIAPGEKVNTYDLLELADIGLVYTTTVGMEMAMTSIPVVVAGKTHYRGRGFTHDPADWPEYFATIDRLLVDPAGARLTRAQVETAWQYAYRFFFDFPRPFPWHLMGMWDDLKARPLSYVLSDEGRQLYGKTFGYLTGEPLDWKAMV